MTAAPVRPSASESGGYRSGRRRYDSTAADVAAALGVKAQWVYAHADELGAIRLGSGPKPRLRFDLDEVISRLASEQSRPEETPAGEPKRRSREMHPNGSGMRLLPIKGRS